jgi:hypothetical protein
VFHSLHDGHRPIHLADSVPQFWQTKIVLFFGIIKEVTRLNILNFSEN